MLPTPAESPRGALLLNASTSSSLHRNQQALASLSGALPIFHFLILCPAAQKEHPHIPVQFSVCKPSSVIHLTESDILSINYPICVACELHAPASRDSVSTLTGHKQLSSFNYANWTSGCLHLTVQIYHIITGFPSCPG